MQLKQVKLTKLSFIGSIFLILSACTTPQDAVQVGVQSEASLEQKFEAAGRLLDEKRYDEAARAYDRLRVQKPASSVDFHILFNSGLAYQSLGDCISAADRYRQLVRMSQGVSPQLQAMARLRLSEMLSCQGQDKLAIVTLVELYKTRRFLPPESAYAEVPARLAVAYSREGNKKQAERYFKEAEAGYSRLMAQASSREKKPLLAKTLFYMGNMKHLNPDRLSGSDYFQTVRTLQPYLFRSLETGVDPWTALATDQIQDAYRNVWAYIDKPIPGDLTPLEQRNRLTEKREVARQALDSIRELYRIHVPTPDEKSKEVKIVFSFLRRTETQIENYLAANRVGTDLTEEAKKASDVRQEIPK